MRHALRYLLGSFCLVHIVSAQFFDYSELGSDDPLAYLWNNRNNLLQDNYAPCTTTLNGGESRDGTCMTSAECRFSRGRSQGRGGCSFWNTCCVFAKTCNQTTNARVSYFTNPTNPRTQPQPCSMRVQLLNDKVCQIRVDILEMDLESPDAVTQTGGLVSHRCIKDRFYVEPSQTNVPIPDLCGTDNNNHFYIHLNRQQLLSRAISLNMLLAASTTPNLDVSSPRWNFKITQLECPTRFTKFNIDKKGNPNQVADDFARLAPDGCLQYFTERTGIVKSFGYNSATDKTLTTGQDYAACFKRSAGSCGVSFTPGEINLREAMNTACMNEWIYFPEETMDLEKQCNVPSSTTPTAIITKHPGPQYIHVHVADPTTDATELAGFSLTYDTNVPC